MKFDIDKGFRGHVFDANGVEVPHVLRGDTSTGIVQRYRFSDNNVLDVDDRGGPIVYTERHPYPLTIKPLVISSKTYRGVTLCQQQSPPLDAPPVISQDHEVQEVCGKQVVELTSTESWTVPPILWDDCDQQD